MVETYIGGPSNQTLFALTRLRLCMQSRAGDFVSIVRTDTCTLGRFQTNQLQMMRMGMGMMKTMFGPDKTSGGAAPPGQ
jgi:hypothetical protein